MGKGKKAKSVKKQVTIQESNNRVANIESKGNKIQNHKFKS